MSGWRTIYYTLLDLPLRLLVQSKVIPANPPADAGLDPLRPIMYVLPYNSKTDLLTLRVQCLQLRLPDPLVPLEIDGVTLPRYVFIHDGPRIFPYFTEKIESVKIFHDYLDLHRSNPQLDVQMVPVSIMFGRSPGREAQQNQPAPSYVCSMGSRNSLRYCGWVEIALCDSPIPCPCAIWPRNTALIKRLRKNWPVSP